MAGISLILQGLLAGILVLLAVLSLQLIALALIRVFHHSPRVRCPRLPEEALPPVVVHLPVCDEGPLAVRVAAAASRMDWPSASRPIQLLAAGPPHSREAL